ncbi:MAG: DUF411 domain-containing protein [Rubrivivax sp.]|nr:DUF411 domain-containing protein [Rubrivivax sp.]MDH5339062.1 DUF411 domain-containing protein [Rubrivivax sp.]
MNTQRHGAQRLASRRAMLFTVLALPFAARAQARDDAALVEVWKSPTCGCCKDWVAHLEANGFRTRVHDTGNTAMRARLGLDMKYGSCHTARVGGYAIEGHVPAADIRRLLKEAPKAIGLAVPGMPVGSPGMDGPAYAGRRDPYDVLLVALDGTSSVFQSHP